MNEITVLNWLSGAMITGCIILATCGIVWLFIHVLLYLFETPEMRRDRKIQEACREYKAEMRRRKERFDAFHSGYVSPLADPGYISPLANKPPSVFGEMRNP